MNKGTFASGSFHLGSFKSSIFADFPEIKCLRMPSGTLG